MARQLWLLASAAAAWPLDVPAETSFGKLVGEVSVTAGEHLPSVCQRWLGVPYAKAPVGSRRFATPEPWEEHWGVREAKKHGSACPQGANKSAVGSEDCLFLNIWRPKSTEKDLAVMVFIHGGGFISGAGDSAFPGPVPAWLSNTYDSCELAAREHVVVVSLNYRLHHLGFACFEEGTTNFGLEDQQAALRWLQAELKAFGGDPAQVTIFGESAGGDSVLLHGASRKSTGLFRAGIVESGMLGAATRQKATQQTERLAQRVGCAEKSSMRDCMRKKSIAELAAADDFQFNPYGALPWSPVIDEVHFQQHPATLYKQGKVNDVPLMLGSNTDDANFFVYLAYINATLPDAKYEAFVEGLLKEVLPAESSLDSQELARLYELYPKAGDDNKAVAGRMVTDAVFTCKGQDLAQDVSKRRDFFHWRFDHRSSCIDSLTHMFHVNFPGVFHTLELPYVFDTPTTNLCIWSKEERALSSRMQKMWAGFAKNMTPGTEFPSYAKSKQSFVFSTSDALEEDYRKEYCKFWKDAVYDKYRSEEELILV